MDFEKCPSCKSKKIKCFNDCTVVDYAYRTINDDEDLSPLKIKKLFVIFHICLNCGLVFGKHEADDNTLDELRAEKNVV